VLGRRAVDTDLQDVEAQGVQADGRMAIATGALELGGPADVDVWQRSAAGSVVVGIVIDLIFHVCSCINRVVD
jgi:hypothetical protein